MQHGGATGPLGTGLADAVVVQDDVDSLRGLLLPLFSHRLGGSGRSRRQHWLTKAWGTILFYGPPKH